MPKKWKYTIEGLGAGGQAWKTSGVVTCEYPDSFEAAMLESFMLLTEGKAEYGNPGVGCSGPYDIQRVLLEQVQRNH